MVCVRTEKDENSREVSRQKGQEACERNLSIMNKLTDIHSHILPGVDDGAKNTETSLVMLQKAWEEGIRRIIVTPHYKPMHHNVSPESMKKMAEKLYFEASRQGMDFEFFTGNEIYYHSEAVNGLDEGKISTMANSEYVLFEFSPMDEYEYIRNGIYQVIVGGYRPILAHIERYACISNKEERVEDLLQMGCYIQINASSITGKLGFATKQFCKKLLKYRMVHFVATDAHDTEKRSPQIQDCAKYISKKYGEEYMRQLLYHNPQCIIRNEYI